MRSTKEEKGITLLLTELTLMVLKIFFSLYIFCVSTWNKNKKELRWRPPDVVAVSRFHRCKDQELVLRLLENSNISSKRSRMILRSSRLERLQECPEGSTLTFRDQKDLHQVLSFLYSWS